MRMFLPPGKTSEYWMQALDEWGGPVYTIESDDGEWRMVEFGAGVLNENEDDGGLIVQSPHCDESPAAAIETTFEEWAEQPCQVYTSPLPESAAMEDCEVGRTCVTFTQTEIPDDWTQPAYDDWWTVWPAEDGPGYTVILPTGAEYEAGPEGQGLVMQPYCFANHRKGAEASSKGDVFNTGFLPDSAELIYDHPGSVEIEIPDQNADVDWQPLWDLGDRVDIQSNDTGGYTVFFPGGSIVKPRDDGTFDIILGEGEPPSKAERMGWTWLDYCTLMLGPKAPEHVETISDELGYLAFLTSPGPETDAWMAAAEEDGRIGLYPQDSGEMMFVFKYGSKLEYAGNGRGQVNLADCTLE